MLIIDNRQIIHSSLMNHGLDLEDFSGEIKQITCDEFMNFPLKSHSDIALLDVASFLKYKVDDQLLSRLNTFLGIIVFTSSPVEKKQQVWLEELLKLSDRVIGLYNLPLNATDWTILFHQLKYFWRQKLEKKALKDNMIKFSQEIDDLIHATQAEMLKAKKIHEDIVPRRIEDIKGINIFTKYAVGDGGGSEYVDIVKTNTSLYLFMIHTNSYLTSSALMSLFNKQKNLLESSLFDTTFFMQQMINEVEAINVHKKKPINVDVLLLKLDHATLDADVYSFGTFEFFSQVKGMLSLSGGDFSPTIVKNTPQKIKLTRGEKLIVFSPGFRFNWREDRDRKTLDKFLDSMKDIGSVDLVMELFFELKKNSNTEFLIKDATVVLLEVSKNAIHKV